MDIELLGWVLLSALVLVWLVDVLAQSDERDRLIAESHALEAETVAGWKAPLLEAGMLDAEAEKLTAVQMAHAYGAWQRLVFSLAPSFLCRLYVAA